MTTTVQVTKADLLNGKPGYGKLCPVALAIRNVRNIIHVGQSGTWFDDPGIQTADYPQGRFYTHDGELALRIHNVDLGHKSIMSPFTIEINDDDHTIKVVGNDS